MKFLKSLTVIFLAVFIYGCSGGGEQGIPEQTTDTGVPYRVLEEGSGDTIQEGQMVGARMKYSVMRTDSTIMSNYGEDLQYTQVGPTRGYGDPSEWFKLLRKGDSAAFYISADTIYQGREMPPFMQAGDMIKSTVKVEDVMSRQEYQSYSKQQQSKDVEGQRTMLEDKLNEAGIEDYQFTDEGLAYHIEEPGNGPTPKNGDVVKVHYIGRLFDGDTFDNSYNREEPIAFTLGKTQLIQGWHQGLPYFKEGAKGTLYLPPALGYGDQSAGPIPPNSSLIFDIELVEITDAEAQAEEARKELESYLQENNINAQQAPEGYYYKIEERGNGPQPKPGQKVKVHYTGRLLNGQKFDSSRDRGEPFEFTLGQGQVIKGWDLGVQQFPVGSKGQLFIPPDLGYGAQGNRSIPGNSPLVFDIEVVSAG